MKKNVLIAAICLAVIMQGCIVKSLHPFYQQSDLIFENHLINGWVDQEGNKWKIERAKNKEKAYQMTFTEGDRDAVFLVHLFELEGNQFLDFQPIASDGSTSGLFDMHLLPSHSVAKVQTLKKDGVSIKWFNEEWLKKLFSQNRIKISHEVIHDPYSGKDEDKSYVITAGTDELRKFLIKYGNDPSAFEGDNAVELLLKPSI